MNYFISSILALAISIQAIYAAGTSHSSSLDHPASDLKVYLIPTQHADTNDRELNLALANKAISKQIILANESIDQEGKKGAILRCVLNLLCDPAHGSSSYIVSVEDPVALTIAHLLYAYPHLSRINLYERGNQAGKAEGETYYGINYQSLPEEIWNSPLCCHSLLVNVWQSILNHQLWDFWQSIDKGPLFEELLSIAAQLREQQKYDLRDFYFHPQIQKKFIPYSRGVALNIRSELEMMLPQMVKQLSEFPPENGVLGKNVKKTLLNIEDHLSDLASTWSKTKIEDAQDISSLENYITNEIADGLRDFLIAQKLSHLMVKAKTLKVPVVLVIGADHIPRVYGFLEQIGVPVEVGMRTNFLNLPPALSQTARSKTLPSAIRQRETAELPDDIAWYLLQKRIDLSENGSLIDYDLIYDYLNEALSYVREISGANMHTAAVVAPAVLAWMIHRRLNNPAQ